MAVNIEEVGIVYNKFMDTTEGSLGLVLASIQAEFDAGRIAGTEYATVYLGAVQTAMQLAINSVQTQEKEEHQAAENELMGIAEREKLDIEGKATIAATEDQYGKNSLCYK